jgi:hypothetical protein
MCTHVKLVTGQNSVAVIVAVESQKWQNQVEIGSLG